jgi:hypothetical protein
MVGLGVAVGWLSLVLELALSELDAFMGEVAITGVVRTDTPNRAVARVAVTQGGIRNVYMEEGAGRVLMKRKGGVAELAKLKVFSSDHVLSLARLLFLPPPPSSGVEETKGGDEGAQADVEKEPLEPEATPAEIEEQQEEEEARGPPRKRSRIGALTATVGLVLAMALPRLCEMV